MAIKTYAQLNAKLNKALKNNMQKVTDVATMLVNQFIKQYYDEYRPVQYVRTYQFLHSVVTTNVQQIGGAYFSSIAINYQDISYLYFAEMKEMAHWGDGYDAISAANQGFHGFETSQYDSDTHFWDDTLDEVWNVTILRDFCDWLEKQTGCKCTTKYGWVSANSGGR